MGKCGCGLVSREFDAIYRRASPSLEPALTLVNGLVLTRSRYVGFGKNAGLWHSLSIQIEAHMGVCGAKFGQAPCGRPGERTFRDEPSPS